MRRFARLYRAIDETTRTNEKVAAMARYFSDAPAADAAWAVWFLSGGRPKRLIPARRLAAWAMEASDVREWLFDECYEAVGDLAETISLLLPAAVATSDLPLHVWIEQRILGLAGQADDAQRVEVRRAWTELDGIERYIFDKLITGGFRVGVSQALVLRALAKASGIEEGALAHRLTGTWEPTPEAYERLVSPERADVGVSQPYPFYLAYALEGEPDALGEATDWQAEWKWDGIRAQVVRRQGGCWIWSRGEELVTARFPELSQMAALLPDGTVLDGEIVAYKDGVLPFGELQKRIGRKTLGKKILADVPAHFIAFDLLEDAREDVRPLSLAGRRGRLEQLITELLGGGGSGDRGRRGIGSSALRLPPLPLPRSPSPSPARSPPPTGPPSSRSGRRAARTAPKASCSSASTAPTASDAREAPGGSGRSPPSPSTPSSSTPSAATASAPPSTPITPSPSGKTSSSSPSRRPTAA